MNLKSRLQKLEAKTPESDDLCIIDWGDDLLEVDGQQMTRAEFDRRYPDAKRIDWSDDHE